MADGLEKSIQVLATTKNRNAVDVLTLALDVDSDEVCAAAARALLKRNMPRGYLEVVRRFARFDAETRRHVEQNAYKLQSAIKQGLQSAEGQLRRSSLEFVRRTEDFQQLPLLVDLLKSDDDSHEPTAETLRTLVARLYELCCLEAASKVHAKPQRNAQQLRQQALAAFEAACDDLQALSHPADVVESLLILGGPEHAAVKKVLAQSSPKCRELTGRLLTESRQPGVMQLLLDAMTVKHPHPTLLETVQSRADVEFICHLLRWFPKRLTPIQSRNFRQVDRVGWIDGRASGLEQIPSGLHQSLVAFVSSTSLPDERKLAVQEWLVRNGSSEARLAATEVLSTLDNRTVQKLVSDSLDADDAETQAWATGQLRAQRIPDAYQLLVERLDSPLEAVRNTAREELESFNLERLLALFDHMDTETCQRAGRLLEKIHPECVADLQRELSSPIRRKRIRAARASMALGLSRRVVPSLMDMLADTDAAVRRQGAEVLGGIPDVACIEALQGLLEDPSGRVRDAARRGLEKTRSMTAPDSVEQPNPNEAGEPVGASLDVSRTSIEC